MRRLLVPFALALAVCAAAPSADQVATALDSVVEVEATGATGTGFVIAGDRVVTAAHVVDQGSPSVRSSQGRQDATIVALDTRRDVAVLHLHDALQVAPLTLAEEAPEPADEVYAATAQPFGAAATVSRGIVSGVVDQTGRETVQTDAAINPGSSGGPLLSPDGMVVGVTSSRLEGVDGVAYAVPASVVTEVIDGGTAPETVETEAARGLVTDSRWPLLAPLAVTLIAVLAGALVEGARHRRRRRPAPGPFDIDVQLRPARPGALAPPHTNEDL